MSYYRASSSISASTDSQTTAGDFEGDQSRWPWLIIGSVTAALAVATTVIALVVIVIVYIRKSKGHHDNIMHTPVNTTANDENQDCNLKTVYYDYPTADHPIITKPNISYEKRTKLIHNIETGPNVSYGMCGTLDLQDTNYKRNDINM